MEKKRRKVNYKLICLAGLITLGINGFAKSYYISNSGNDSHNGLSIETAWRTIDKVNNSYFKPGDSILFKRGETFHGGLIISNSGNTLYPIVYSAFGKGNKPIISGFKKQSEWNNLENGIVSCQIQQPELNLISINGKNTSKGRFPDTGWLTYEIINGKTSIIDEQLSSIPNWNNAEAVIEKNHWTIDRNIITNHTDNTINYIAGSSDMPRAGCRYFIQNHPETLNRFSEWYANNSTLYLYIGDSSINEINVEIPIVNTLIDVNSKNSIYFESLNFTGSNKFGTKIYLSVNIRFTNCDFSLIAEDAVNSTSSKSLNVINCNFNECNGNGIYTTTALLNIKGCKFRNIGLLPGMGGNKGSTYNGIRNDGGKDGAIIEYNEFYNCGYNAITCMTDNFVVRYNKVVKSNQILSDGASLYTYLHYDDSSRVCYNREMHHNIVLQSGSNAIYSDGYTNNLKVHHNTVAYCKKGVMMNEPRRNQLHNNIFFKDSIREIKIQNAQGLAAFAWGNIIRENIFVMNNNNSIYVLHDGNGEKIYNFGKSEDNLFCLNKEKTKMMYSFTLGDNNKWLRDTVEQIGWQSKYKKDLSSKFSYEAEHAVLFYNDSQNDSIIKLNTPFYDLEGQRYLDEIQLKSFESTVLIKEEIDSITLKLKKGWNLISLSINPMNKHWDEVFADLLDKDQLLLIQDMQGNNIKKQTSETWINTIGLINYQKAYNIKVTENCEMNVKGYHISYPERINLNKGWNLIPYFSERNSNGKSFLNDLIEEGIFIKAIDEEGNTIEFKNADGELINSIGNFISGKAYYVNTKENTFVEIN